MVIERPIGGFTAWDGGGGRKPLSPRSLLIGGLILAAHLAGAAYLYTLHTAPPAIAPEPESKAIEVNTVRFKTDTPPKPTPQHENVVPLHRPAQTIPITVTPLTFPPQPEAKVTPGELPQILPDVVKPSVVTAPTNVGPKQIRNPNWITRPTPEQLTQFYPPRALDEGLSGQATLDCLVTASGQLTRCVTSGETPAGRGFAEAALKASRIFRMSPRTEDGQPVDGGTVHIPMRFAVNN